MRMICSPSVVLFSPSENFVIKKELVHQRFLQSDQKSLIHPTFLVLHSELCNKKPASHLLKVLFSSRRGTERNTESMEDLQNDIFLFPFLSPTQNSEEPKKSFIR